MDEVPLDKKRRLLAVYAGEDFQQQIWEECKDFFFANSSDSIFEEYARRHPIFQNPIGKYRTSLNNEENKLQAAAEEHKKTEEANKRAEEARRLAAEEEVKSEEERRLAAEANKKAEEARRLAAEEEVKEGEAIIRIKFEKRLAAMEEAKAEEETEKAIKQLSMQIKQNIENVYGYGNNSVKLFQMLDGWGWAAFLFSPRNSQEILEEFYNRRVQEFHDLSISLQDFKKLFVFRIDVEVDTVEDSAIQTLKSYIQIGNLISSDEIINTIENSLDLMVSNDNPGYCALGVPSMTGKTQASFALKRKVIYFNFTPKSQLIYRCFESISQAFLKALRFDYYYARSVNEDKLLVTLRDVRVIFGSGKGESRVLGLLLMLINKIENDCSESKNRHWSEVLMEKQSFSYYSCSIEAFKSSMEQLFGETWKEKLKEFVMILDEFPSSSAGSGAALVFEAALGRNIARAVNLPCLVMGTNTKISNLVEAGTAGSSSVTDIFRLWCSLFTRLPPTNWNYLVIEYHIQEIFLKIVEFFGQDIGERLERFLEGQIKSSRPGISKNICDALCELCENGLSNQNSYPLIQFMNNLASKIQFFITNRKDSLKAVQSIPGHLELFMSNIIELYQGKSVDQSAMINHHMFYLINNTRDPHMQLYARRVVEMNNSSIYNDTNSMQSWIPTVSITSPLNEAFLYWTCWGCFDGTGKWFFSKSIMNFYLNLWREKQAIRSIRENTLAYFNDGRVGEHIAHILVIFCSHLGGLGGINGVDFVKWLVKHSLDIEDVHNPELEVIINRRSKLEKFLNSFGVCYLSPNNSCGPENLLGKGWPSELCDGVMWNAGIRLGIERGARNNEMIDGEMEIYSVDGKGHFIGKLEVKLHQKNLSPSCVTPIMEKNAPKSGESVFSLIFCQLVSSPVHFDSAGPFQLKCQELRANVYTIVKSGPNKYQIVPLSEKIDNPKMLCLILPVLFSTLQDYMTLAEQMKQALITSNTSVDVNIIG